MLELSSQRPQLSIEFILLLVISGVSSGKSQDLNRCLEKFIASVLLSKDLLVVGQIVDSQ